VATPTAVGIDDDLAAGEAGSPCGPPMTSGGRVDEIFRFLAQHPRRDDLLDDVFDEVFSIVAWATSAVCCVEMTTFTTSTGTSFS